MKKIKSLTSSQLYTSCSSNQFAFKTTNDIDDCTDIVGQERALHSLHFGIGVQHYGFNLYVLGSSGIGKHAIIKHELHDYVAGLPCPDDWCYVHNFSDPRRPLALKIDSGFGEQLKLDMDSFITDVRMSVSAVLESDEYRARIQEIDDQLKAEQEQLFAELQKRAEQDSLTILSTPHGFAVAPTKNGEVINAKDFALLSKKDKKQRERHIKTIRSELTSLLRQMPLWQKRALEAKKEMQKELVHATVSYLLKDIKKKYKQFTRVVKYLHAVENDIIEHITDFTTSLETDTALKQTQSGESVTDLIRYRVNVLVSHSRPCVPIIYDDNPTYPNLVGRIDQKVQYGTLVTDFTLIRAGSMHHANGGYLLVDAIKILTLPYAWQGLKRALYATQIHIEPIGEMVGMLSTITLDPEAIPLNLKIIMIGDRMTYYALCELDPDFTELFKVAVDFSEEFPRNKENEKLFAGLIASLVKKAKLHAFSRGAVARVIEYASRIIDDAEFLSLRVRALEDLLCEADYWSQLAKRTVVGIHDVETAILQQKERVNRAQRKYYDEILRNTLLISTSGVMVGQINALALMSLGDFQFGIPARVTASARIGKGEIVNIEREAELSGNIHTKAVLILYGFLNDRYAKEKPLSLTATLVIEQSYVEVEGDSASLAELCALLSAIADVPMRQSLAITGSVNQHGQAQAIGGVNNKIEGFFTICQDRGLTGEQGVIIPAVNTKHLMLSKEVRKAVAAKKFHVYPVQTIDEALQLFTGIKAGVRNRRGQFTKNSINAIIEERLLEFAQRLEGEHK